MKFDLVRALLAGESVAVFDPKAEWKAQTAPIVQPGGLMNVVDRDGA